MTIVAAFFQYQDKINYQYNIDISAHTFWTANSVVDPINGASLKYKVLHLRPLEKS